MIKSLDKQKIQALFSQKTETPPSPFFDHLSFFIRIFWIGQGPPPLLKRMVKKLSFWSKKWSKMVKKNQFLVQNGKKNLSIF